MSIIQIAKKPFVIVVGFWLLTLVTAVICQLLNYQTLAVVMWLPSIPAGAYMVWKGVGSHDHDPELAILGLCLIAYVFLFGGGAEILNL